MLKKREILPVRQEIPVHNTDAETGLTAQQVRERAEGGWSNHAPADPSRSEREIILSKVVTFFNFIFVVLAVVLVLAGSSIKNMAFLVIAVTNTAIGVCQEIRAKRAVEKLSLVAQKTVDAVRDGQICAVAREELVRDDVIVLSAGDQICADGVVCTGALRVNESLVTGEEDAIEKNPGDALLSGSFVVTGTARARLTKVGADSFVSRLTREAKANPRAAKSEMMRSLDKLIRVIGIALVPMGGLLFYQQYVVLEQSMRTATEGMVAALIGMIPEGLYLLTSIAMAASALKLTRRRVLVQDMNCIETLARVDVLCLDKTGTITENRMQVEDVVVLSQRAPEELEAILTALFSGEDNNATGMAVREMFPGECGWECTRRVPFDTAYKWSGGEFAGHGAFVAGAPEVILGDGFAQWADQVENWSDQGYRVIAAAAYHGLLEPGSLESGKVEALAFLLLSNRIRPEAYETFRYFRDQGVTVKVISGDHPRTVAEIAARAGISGTENYVDARLLSNEELAEAAETGTVFGRVTPDQKRVIIQALHKNGHTVAMTGDGVNDVLAMRDADCSIAMAAGAQAATQVSKMVLLDSDFSAMPDIVGEGRRVINNIQRAATLFLVKNIFSVALTLITFFTFLPYPMVPVHMSVISGLTIGVPAFFLAMEPNYERVSGSFLRGVLRRALPGGLTNVFVVLAAQAYMTVFGLSQEETSTVCAAILAFVGLLVLFQVCKPFDVFRGLIWCAMGGALIICFTLLGDFFALRTGSAQIRLIMATLLVMSPSVFMGLRWFFDRVDRISALLRARRKKDADL